MYGIVRIRDCQIDYSKLVTNYEVYEGVGMLNYVAYWRIIRNFSWLNRLADRFDSQQARYTIFHLSVYRSSFNSRRYLRPL